MCASVVGWATKNGSASFPAVERETMRPKKLKPIEARPQVIGLTARRRRQVLRVNSPPASNGDVRALPWIGKAEGLVNGVATLIRLFLGSFGLGVTAFFARDPGARLLALIRSERILPPTLLLLTCSIAVGLLLNPFLNLLSQSPHQHLREIVRDLQSNQSPEFVVRMLSRFLVAWVITAGATRIFAI